MHFSEKGFHQGRKPGMFFDEVDEDGRVYGITAATTGWT
jgi:hypothetical protein